MKPFLIRLVRIYFGLGAVFGGLGIPGYVWGLATQADCRDFVLGVMVMVYAVFEAAVRTLVWLPSLIHWWLAERESMAYARPSHDLRDLTMTAAALGTPTSLLNGSPI
jgi:hypothetical protein